MDRVPPSRWALLAALGAVLAHGSCGSSTGDESSRHGGGGQDGGATDARAGSSGAGASDGGWVVPEDAWVLGSDVPSTAPPDAGDACVLPVFPDLYPCGPPEDQECAPDVGLTGGRSTCCNGEPCKGTCLPTADGGRVCDCFGIRGGCPLDRDLFCCDLRVGCADLDSCVFGH